MPMKLQTAHEQLHQSQCGLLTHFFVVVLFFIVTSV